MVVVLSWGRRSFAEDTVCGSLFGSSITIEEVLLLKDDADAEEDEGGGW